MRALLSLFVICVIDVLGFGIIVPLIPYMATRFGATATVATAVLALYSACQFIAAPIWGRLSDRYGRRPILALSMAGACVSYLMLGFAPSLAWVMAARMLAGFMAGNLSAAMAYAADVSTPDQRARALGMVGAAIGIGFMIGPALGGVLAGESLAAANFLRPALVSASLSVLAIVLVLTVLRESNSAAQRAQHRQAETASHPWRLLRALPTLRWLSLAALLVTFSVSTFESIFAIWAMHRYGVGPRTAGLAMFVVAIVAVLMQGVLVRRLVPRLGEHRLAIAGIVSNVAGLALIAMAGPRAMVIAGLVLCGIGAGAFNPCASALASRQASERNRGAVMGTYQTGTSLARILAAFSAGPIYDHAGASAPLLFAGFISLQALWCILATLRQVPTEALT